MNKNLHVYDWDHEPKEERESVFASTSFGANTSAVLSGYHPAMDPLRRAARPRRFGFIGLLLFALLLLLAGGWALHRLAPMLKGG